jgi:hypothetical protein
MRLSEGQSIANFTSVPHEEAEEAADAVTQEVVVTEVETQE